MANFIVYGTRLPDRKLPTIHVVGTFASGGYDLINVGGPYSVGETAFLDQSDTTGFYGSSAPDIVGGNTTGESVSAIFPAEGNFEVVGVQIVAVGTIFNNLTPQIIKGESLVNYVEKTEYRYLENGHSMLKVYFSDANANLGDLNGDAFMVSGAVLLQKGSLTLGREPEKRSVPFVLNLPYESKNFSGDDFPHNPTVDVASFIYGNDGDNTGNFGTEVHVTGMGTTSDTNSINWNTVRSQSWNFGTHNPSDVLSTADADLPDDRRFYSFYHSPYISSTGKTEAAVRRVETARSGFNMYTLGSSEIFPDDIEINSFGGNLNLHTASGVSFDLREMHQFGGQYIGTAAGAKQTFGRFVGARTAAPKDDTPRYGEGIPVGSQWPAVQSGDRYIRFGQEISNHSEGIGMPHLMPNAPGGKAHFWSTGKPRNMFYPTRDSAFSHYITFFKIQGFGAQVPDGQYLPTAVGDMDIASINDFPGYIADQFRTSCIGYASGAMPQQVQSYSVDNVDWYAPSTQGFSPMRAVSSGALSWQDYIANAIRCNGAPGTGHNVLTTANMVVADSGFPGEDDRYIVDEYDVRFSGAVQASGAMHTLHTRCINEGLALNGTTNNFSDNQPAGEIEDIRQSRLFLYTVFMYSDSPQPRIPKDNQDTPLYDFLSDPVFSANNAYLVNRESTNFHARDIIKDPDGNLLFTNHFVEWGSSTINFTCVDRNSATAQSFYMTDGEQSLLANDNSCLRSGYLRCGCENAVEELAPGELNNFVNLPAGQQRFESVIIYPRPVTTNQTSNISAANAFPSIYYINSYFAPLDATGTATLSPNFALSYLGNDDDATNVTFDTSTGATHTHTLSELGLQDYGTLPFQAEYNTAGTPSVDDNTFKYLYMPGREGFEAEDSSAYFVHDSADEAKIYMTILGAGADTPSGGDDRPHRQLLLFEAANDASASTSLTRAHCDLTFSQAWHKRDVEASYLSLGATDDCITATDDKPRHRIRKFVVVTGQERDTDIPDGDGGHDDGGDDDILGCTDVTAINYNPAATVDDGSCINCDTEADTGAGVAITNIDPIHYIPFFYQGVGQIGGTANRTTGATNVSIGGSFEVPFPTGSGSLSYPWWAGNAFNAFNTRGPNAELTFGALNTPSSSPTDYTASPYNNTANSKFTYFRAVGQTASINDVALAGTAWQFGGTASAEVQAAAIAALETLGAENAASIEAKIFRYSDWETLVATGDNATIPNETDGNNGWYLDDYGVGNLSAVYPNVYSDTEGDYSALNLDSATAITTLNNQMTGEWGFKFDFRNYQGSPEQIPLDIGLEAGEQYVIVWRFYPKLACSNDRKFYYWAANFFVEYCECTDVSSTVVGGANPPNLDSSVYPANGYPWSGSSVFPGVNNPNDQVALTSQVGGTAFAQNFCSTADNPDSPGLVNQRLCTEAELDETIDCDGFASWCLSDILPQCNYDEFGNPFGSISFAVLIDGFFTQSEVDQWSLQPFGSPYQNAQLQYFFYWRVRVFMNGVENTDVSPIYSHIFDAVTGQWEPNPQVVFDTLGGADSTFYGQIASIQYNDLEWDDDVTDNIATGVPSLQLTVELEYLGMIQTGVVLASPVVNTEYPDYVVDAENQPVDGCSTYELAYEADFSDCIGSVPGCTDPLADNYTENATVDDGSCEYTDCTELFDAFRNSIFITEFEATNDTLDCVVQVQDEVEFNQWTPQYEGTLEFTVQDFSDGVLGITGDSIPNFVLCVLRLTGGAASALATALQDYDNNAAAIQALSPGGFLVGSGFTGCFIMPPSETTAVTSVAGQVDVVGTQGVEYEIPVPNGAIFNTIIGQDETTGEDITSGGLPAGQYMAFVIPHIDLSLYENDASGIADCGDVFLSFTDEMTFAGIDNELGDSNCPEPCNQFTNPEDCPDAVPGCTDPTADNYNEDATFDDGSCEYCTDCDPCDLYPLDPDCGNCVKGDETGTDPLARVAGFGARLRECDGDPGECCPDPDALNYDAECEGDANMALCEYDTDGEPECGDEDYEGDEDCDPGPPCPDPTNEECDNTDTGNCIDDGDCPCTSDNCDQDCTFDDSCDEDDDEEDEIEDNTSTTTLICVPSPDIPIPTITINGQTPQNIAHAAAICQVDKGDKMVMKIKAGVEYDETDLLKLSLINYIFTAAAQQNLDCIFDCDNYESDAKSGGKIRNRTTRARGAVDCSKRWASNKKQHFAGSSSYKKGTTVKYVRVKNGKLVSSFFTAKRDWRPGMDIPLSIRDKELRSWEPCFNIKYQEGTNPENYWRTFWEFLSRFCSSCELVTAEEEQNDGEVVERRTGTFGSSFRDEFGNEIIF